MSRNSSSEIRHLIVGCLFHIVKTNLLNGITVTFDAPGDGVVLYFNGTNWILLAANGVAVA